MNVASLELCKELYELSGWKDTYFGHYYFIATDFWGVHPQIDGRSTVGRTRIPAYDLGYLLRRLPKDAEVAIFWAPIEMWEADYDYQSEDDGYAYREIADTPEDAAAKLAIELFKQGVLTRVGDE